MGHLDFIDDEILQGYGMLRCLSVFATYREGLLSDETLLNTWVQKQNPLFSPSYV